MQIIAREGIFMAKGKNKGGKEVKKPKQKKVVV